MATNIKFHRITATSGSNINTGTNYTKGDVYFIKSATGNTGKVYICTVAGKGTAATLEDYSVDTNTWRPVVNNLTSTSTDSSLSAAMGKSLSDSITSLNSSTVKKDGTGASGTWGINISGNAATATKVGKSTVGSATMPVYINGGAPTAITSFPEAYLSWGGTNTAGSVTPIGMTLSSEHSANRLAFINGNALTFEYSSNAGSTWTDYGYTASIKSQVFTTLYDVPIGRADSAEYTTEYTTNSRTRITLTAQDGTNGYVYTNPRKMLINISSSGGMQVLIEYRTGTNYKNNGAWTTFGTYTLLGWSGWNDIPLILDTLGGGSTQTANKWQLRLTFIMTSKNADYPNTAYVNGIRIFGENAWTSPSTMAATGHLYTFDVGQNATFPAKVTATGGFSGNLTGNADTSNSSNRAKFLETFQQNSTTTTYGSQYPIWAQWSDSANVKLKCTNYTVWTDKATYATSAGSAPASDVYSWAKQSTKPSYSFSEITSKPTTLAGYGITETDGYLNKISKSGNTLTITPKGGTAFTFTNTTYSRKWDDNLSNSEYPGYGDAVAGALDTSFSLVNIGDMKRWNKTSYMLEGLETLLASI